MDVDRDAHAVVRSEIDVAAPPQTVWELVAGIEGWPAWNPAVKEARLEGSLEPGSTFRWKAGPGTIVSTLRVIEPPREIGWTGRTFGIEAVHVYRLEPAGDGTRVVSEESWSGLPVRLLRSRMARRLEADLGAGLRDLKTEAERKSS